MFKYAKSKMSVVAVLAATSLTLAACGDDSEETLEEPTTEAQEATEEATSTETMTSEETTSSAAAESSSASAGGSGVVAPPADFAPANNGDHFKLGETAQIKTTNYDGAEFYLTVRVDPRTPITAEEVSKNAGGQEIEDLGEGDQLFCFPVTITYEGVEGDTTGTPSLLTSPVDAVGNRGGTLYYGGDVACGVHRGDKMPSLLKQLEPGKEYKTAEIAIDSPGTVIADSLKVSYDVGEQKHDIYFDM